MVCILEMLKCGLAFVLSAAVFSNCSIAYIPLLGEVDPPRKGEISPEVYAKVYRRGKIVELYYICNGTVMPEPFIIRDYDSRTVYVASSMADEISKMRDRNFESVVILKGNRMCK